MTTSLQSEPGLHHLIDSRLGVMTSDGATYPGRLLEVKAGGLEAELPRAGFPTVPLGSELRLALTARDTRGSFEIPATLTQRVQRAERWCLGFAFHPVLDGEDRLRELLDRRSDVRVRVPVGESVAVEVTVPSIEPVDTASSGPRGTRPPSIQGLLRDISAMGAGVSLDVAAEEGFAAFELVELRLALPPSDHPLRLCSWIRSRRLEEQRAVYGIEFDPNLTLDFRRQQSAVLEYVALRRRRGDLGREEEAAGAAGALTMAGPGDPATASSQAAHRSWGLALDALQDMIRDGSTEERLRAAALILRHVAPLLARDTHGVD